VNECSSTVTIQLPFLASYFSFTEEFGDVKVFQTTIPNIFSASFLVLISCTDGLAANERQCGFSFSNFR